jgi:hypothetical protein
MSRVFMGLPAGEPVARQDIGERGQWLFSLLMTDLCGRDDPFFRPRFLGNQYPTFDDIVEVVDRPSYFFACRAQTSPGSWRSGVRHWPGCC